MFQEEIASLYSSTTFRTIFLNFVFDLKPVCFSWENFKGQKVVF